MNLGTACALWRYPIKSLRGETLPQIEIERDGTALDRHASLVIGSDHPRRGKSYRGKEDGRLHRLVAAPEAIAAAQERDVALAVVEADGGHAFDAAPVSLLIDRWLDGVSDAVGYRVEYERFRANILIAATAAFAREESDLVGHALRLGTVRLRVTAPIRRCVTVTYNPEREGDDPAVLRYLATERANTMGVYCEVLRAGIVCIGDALVLEEC